MKTTEVSEKIGLLFEEFKAEHAKTSKAAHGRARKTLGEILTYEGYRIIEASDGEEGLRKFKESVVDVVLCDIKMPKMDGIKRPAK